MAEKPILFKGEMVRAILAARKTMTRRVIKPQPDYVANDGTPLLSRTLTVFRDGKFQEVKRDEKGNPYVKPIKCPYQVGDTLWVKETWMPWAGGNADVVYRADMDESLISGKGWKCSLFMPRWASRITLEVTAVKVERLQYISNEDARCEGCCGVDWGGGGDYGGDANYLTPFATLWDSINAKPKPVYADKKIVAYECYPWSDESFDALYPGARERGTWRSKPLTVVSNPWVFAYTFGRIDG